MDCLKRHISYYSFHFRLRQIVLLALIGCCSLVGMGQISPDLGQLSIENFTTKTYKAGAQNFAITQDLQGKMYFGNAEGVLIYDGLNWELIKTANESAIRSLDVSPYGSIYVGAVGDFGYLTVDASGKNKYVSLQQLFQLESDEVEDVYHVHAMEQGVYFMTNKRIYYYTGKKLKIWDSESLFQSAYAVNGKYIVNQISNGLCELKGDSVVALSEVNDFKNIRIYDILKHGREDMLVLTEKNGVYHFYKNVQNDSSDEHYRTKINTELQDFKPNNGVYINAEILSIGTWGYGLLLVDAQGDVIQHINSAYGLNDEVINDQFLDREGNLWLATSNGISFIALNQSFAHFSDKANVHETVESVTEFDNKIFLATHTGLFYQVKNDKKGGFVKLPGLDEECWGLLTFQKGDEQVLLIAENHAVYELNAALKLTKITDCFPWTFHRSKTNPSLVFVGLDDGLFYLKYQGGAWQVMEKIEDIDYPIYSIIESKPNEFWLGSPDWVTKLNMEMTRSIGSARFKIEKFGTEEGLPTGDITVEEMGKDLVFGTADGMYKFDEASKTFSKDSSYTLAFGSRPFQVHQLYAGKTGELWMSAYFQSEFYVGNFTESSNGIQWSEKEFLPFSNEVYHAFYQDDFNFWLGGPNGVYRYEMGNDFAVEALDVKAILTGVILNNDSTAYAGNMGFMNYGDTAVSERSRATYPYDFNSICFTFASQNYKYQNLNQYSYKLEGFGDKWSEWSSEPKAVFTNLHEGYYKFLIKSRNAYKQESQVVAYAFKIEAPWYRAWWAYFMYLILAALLVYSIVTMYTQQLKDIIREKTAEVVAQKDEIERQKDEVEHQRHELEVKNTDITSSINYARRLQRAILPEESLIKKHLPDAFILYKPKDIVSGDFYWMEHVNGATGHDVTLFAAVDCTGHGVPGAFVSVVGNGGLNRAVNEFGLVQPAMILEKLNEIVVDTLSKGESEVRDGMDISLCSFDFGKMEMQFAGANNSAYLVRKNVVDAELGLNGNGKFHKQDLVEIKPNKQPVGYYEFKEDFVNHTVKVQKGDIIYLFSDGFADQFGGPRGKKYNYPRFKDFLVSISDKPMEEQQRLIEEEFESWRGKEEQIDDVVVAGIRI